MNTKNELNTESAEFIQDEYNKEFGINIDIDYSTDSTSYYAKRADGDFDLAYGRWGADFLDPSNFFDIFKTGAGDGEHIVRNCPHMN